MTIAYQIAKAKRGTKRVCQACNVPFYDLLRELIICPNCREQYVVTAPLADITDWRDGARRARSLWTAKVIRKPHPARPGTEAGASPTSELTTQELNEELIELVEEPSEADTASDPNADIVLDQETDDASQSVLAELDTDQSKEI
jgi:hypothetical protein